MVAIRQLAGFIAEDFKIDEEDLKYISPARFGHLNVSGKYSFPMKGTLSLQGLRQLQKTSLL